jgi:serine protease inhibitor
MNRRLLCWLAFLVLLLGACAGPAPSPIQASPLSEVRTAPPTAAQAQALGAFGAKLFAQVRADGSPNPVISPLSVFYALGMVDDGARGQTAEAFEQVLGLSAEQAREVAAICWTSCLTLALAPPWPRPTRPGWTTP